LAAPNQSFEGFWVWQNARWICRRPPGGGHDGSQVEEEVGGGTWLAQKSHDLAANEIFWSVGFWEVKKDLRLTAAEEPGGHKG
jgi:hypothetical protein